MASIAPPAPSLAERRASLLGKMRFSTATLAVQLAVRAAPSVTSKVTSTEPTFEMVKALGETASARLPAAVQLSEEELFRQSLQVEPRPFGRQIAHFQAHRPW